MLLLLALACRPGESLATERLPVEMPPPAPRPAAPPVSGEASQASSPATSPSLRATPRPSAEGPHGRPLAGAGLPPAERACRQRLRDAGAVFEARAALAEPAGCSLPYPLLVSSLAPGIRIEPPALLNCATAEAATLFARAVVAPRARERFGAGLAVIRQASAYVCRPRADGAKLSEHAFGNALDISGFELDDGRGIPVEASRDGTIRDFLREIRGKACGPFKTVLGPGSNADHATHFHFDLASRRNGGTWCR